MVPFLRDLYFSVLIISPSNLPQPPALVPKLHILDPAPTLYFLALAPELYLYFYPACGIISRYINLNNSILLVYWTHGSISIHVYFISFLKNEYKNKMLHEKNMALIKNYVKFCATCATFSSRDFLFFISARLLMCTIFLQ